MAIPLRKIIHRTSTLLGRPACTAEQAAVRVQIICPAEKAEVRPAIYNPDDLQRVTTVFHDTTMESELQRLQGGMKVWAATRAFHMENVVLEDGSFYCDGWRLRASGRPHRWSGGKSTEIDQAALATSYCGSMWFSHWVTDDLTMHLEAERFGRPVTIARPLYHNEPYYADVLNTGAEALTRARLHKLVYFDDVGQNSSKRRRYWELRSRIHKKHPMKGADRIFIHRGKSGAARNLLNEEALEELLARDGFVIVDPEKQPTHEVLKACSGAKIVVGVEGSQLIHGFIAMRQRGAILAMMPPYRFINHYKDLADCADLHYGMIIGTAANNGFLIDPDELRRQLERVEQKLD
jgi:hypothetical protein